MGEARSRAAAVLGLAEEATSEQAMTAFLMTLRASDFVPSGETIAAVNALAVRTVPPDPDSDGEIGLPEEVEEFVRQFWSLEAAERGARWAALAGRPADARSAARLEALKLAIGLDAPPPTDPLDAEIVALARELFLLPPGARAVRRNDWLLANVARHGDLCRAAVVLRKRSPTVGELDPVLFERLSPAFAAAEFISAVASQPLPDPPTGSRDEAMRLDFAERLAAAHASHRNEQPDSNESQSRNMGCVVLFAVFLLIRVISCTGSSDSSPSGPYKQYSPPQPYRLSTPNTRPDSPSVPSSGYEKWWEGAGRPDPQGQPRPRK